MVVILRFFVLFILEWNSVIYIGIQRKPFRVDTRSIGIGTSIPNRPICLVRTGATVSNRHIRSAETGYPLTDISIRSQRVKLFAEQTHLFAEQTLPFAYHFQCWTKRVFALFGPIQLLFYVNFRLEYLIHSETKLNMWIYNVHRQWKDNIFQPSLAHSKQRAPPKIQLKFFPKTHLINSKFLSNMFPNAIRVRYNINHENIVPKAFIKEWVVMALTWIISRVKRRGENQNLKNGILKSFTIILNI